IAAGSLLAGAALGRFLPLPEPADLNLNPLHHWTAPPLGLDLEPSSGPIIIEIEYHIAAANVPAFLALMSERRRIRMRDGAHRWTLVRNLEEPERWTMSYQFPTWVEYVRHNQRMTEGDAAIAKQILALHTGPEPPRINRLVERHPDW